MLQWSCKISVIAHNSEIHKGAFFLDNLDTTCNIHETFTLCQNANVIKWHLDLIDSKMWRAALEIQDVLFDWLQVAVVFDAMDCTQWGDLAHLVISTMESSNKCPNAWTNPTNAPFRSK